MKALEVCRREKRGGARGSEALEARRCERLGGARGSEAVEVRRHERRGGSRDVGAQETLETFLERSPEPERSPECCSERPPGCQGVHRNAPRSLLRSI